jgi:hypothetical protein
MTMIRRAAVLRRVVASVQSKNARTFQSSSILGRDALDMVDTFARRHSKSKLTFFTTCFLVAYVMMASRFFVTSCTGVSRSFYVMRHETSAW